MTRLPWETFFQAVIVPGPSCVMYICHFGVALTEIPERTYRGKSLFCSWFWGIQSMVDSPHVRCFVNKNVVAKVLYLMMGEIGKRSLETLTYLFPPIS